MGLLSQEEINVDLFDEVKRLKLENELLKSENELLQAKWEAQGLMIQKLHKENSKHEETIRIYKVSDELVKEQSKKVKHLFPLENTVGYGQLCDKVLELSEEKSFFVKAYTEKIMKED